MKQLIHSDKLARMGTLAAGVAHEVNNPLASISSIIQMMRSRNGADPETREELEVISAQIDRITRVTKDLTDFARTRPAAYKLTDINEVIDAALRLASFDASFQRLQITTAFGRDLPQVLADRDQLQQLFLNVLLNARDAMPDGGELKVATSADESYVRISIDDTGSGITPDDLKHVFDPFFTTKPSGRGTGLGLAVCYGIITAHGGKMEITNLDNTGTQVNIAVPFEA